MATKPHFGFRGVTATNVLRIHGKLSQPDNAKYILKTGGNTAALIDILEKSALAVRDRDTE